MRKKQAGTKHSASAKRARKKCETHRRCRTRPEKCVKQTVDAKYWENIYLLSESYLVELNFEHAAQRTANDLVISGSYATALSKAVSRVSFLGQPLWTAAARSLQRSEQGILLNPRSPQTRSYCRYGRMHTKEMTINILFYFTPLYVMEVQSASLHSEALAQRKAVTVTHDVTLAFPRHLLLLRCTAAHTTSNLHLHQLWPLLVSFHPLPTHSV
jgi:hypothetical protein